MSDVPSDAIEAVPIETVSIEAGPVSFVVEHRRLVQDGVEAGGPTVRVVGTDDGHEYLRFDMFDVGAHYHYEPPGADERILRLDTVAEGEPIAWMVARLQRRLAPMLTAAGGEHLVGALDDRQLAGAVELVERHARAG